MKIIEAPGVFCGTDLIKSKLFWISKSGNVVWIRAIFSDGLDIFIQDCPK